MARQEITQLLEAVEHYDVLMPTKLRRFTILGLVGLLGVLAAYALSSFVGYYHAVPIVLALALLAGISALWSP